MVSSVGDENPAVGVNGDIMGKVERSVPGGAPVAREASSPRTCDGADGAVEVDASDAMV